MTTNYLIRVSNEHDREMFSVFGALRYGGNVTSENVNRLKYIENRGRKSYQIKSGPKLILKRGKPERCNENSWSCHAKNIPNGDEHIFIQICRYFSKFTATCWFTLGIDPLSMSPTFLPVVLSSNIIPCSRCRSKMLLEGKMGLP